MQRLKDLKRILNNLKEEAKDQIPGGLADGISLADIAHRHGVPLSHIEAEHMAGIDVELEHTNDKSLAAEIAMDHLWEDPDYYTRLKRMEREAEIESGLKESLLDKVRAQKDAIRKKLQTLKPGQSGQIWGKQVSRLTLNDKSYRIEKHILDFEGAVSFLVAFGIQEDAPANSVGSSPGNIAGVSDQNPPGSKATLGAIMRRKRKEQGLEESNLIESHLGVPIFDVDDESFNNLRNGKKKWTHWRKYISKESKHYKPIREYARKHRRRPVVLRNGLGETIYVRYNRHGGGGNRRTR